MFTRLPWRRGRITLDEHPGIGMDDAMNEAVVPMSHEGFASVWDAIEDTRAEAENMKLRSALMMALEYHIRAQGWTQAEAARRLSVTQPHMSDLLRGKIHLVGLDTLVNMAAAAGLHVDMGIAISD